MYRTFDEEVFLAPESIISGILGAAAASDDLEDLDFDAFPDRDGGTGADPDPDDEDDFDGDEPAYARQRDDAVAAWSRHARGANGFGDA